MCYHFKDVFKEIDIALTAALELYSLAVHPAFLSRILYVEIKMNFLKQMV